jgi:hypothetical protein
MNKCQEADAFISRNRIRHLRCHLAFPHLLSWRFVQSPHVVLAGRSCCPRAFLLPCQEIPQGRSIRHDFRRLLTFAVALQVHQLPRHLLCGVSDAPLPAHQLLVVLREFIRKQVAKA